MTSLLLLFINNNNNKACHSREVVISYYLLVRLLLYYCLVFGLDVCVFVVGWKHALGSEWPCISIINIIHIKSC